MQSLEVSPWSLVMRMNKLLEGIGNPTRFRTLLQQQSEIQVAIHAALCKTWNSHCPLLSLLVPFKLRMRP